MYVFKTSGETLDGVLENQRHAFRGRPKDWNVGELVLVSKNIKDCEPGEKQIQFTMRIRRIRPIRSLTPVFAFNM